jgi:CBS domain-containing protein
VFDDRSRFECPDGQLLPPACCHIVVDPEAPLNAVLRAIDQAGARLALVTRTAPEETQEVLGVITERDIARLAYATARLTD